MEKLLTVYAAKELAGLRVEGATMKSRPETPSAEKSILDAIGWKQLCAIVWHAMPFPWRWIAFPYGILVYRRLLAASDTLRYLRAMHAKEFSSSFTFRLLRPRYRKVEHLLRDYGFRDEMAERRHAGEASKIAASAQIGARRQADVVSMQEK
jgi:hypothetical protein